MKKRFNFVSKRLLALILTALILTAPIVFADDDAPTHIASFDELVAAINACSTDNLELEIVDDLAFTAPITISKDINIGLTAGSPVSLTQNAGRHFIITGDSVALNFDSNITLDGGSLGGGIEVDISGTFNLTGNITNCVATEIVSVQVPGGNTMVGIDAALGGALIIKSGTVDLTSSTISGSSADIGGAVFVCAGGTLNANGVSFCGNKANRTGGALTLETEGKANINSSNFSSNYAKERGGAIDLLRIIHFGIATQSCGCLPYLGHLKIDSTAFSGNSVHADSGSASFLDKNDNASVFAYYVANITNVISVSANTYAYNNYDICYERDYTPLPLPPVILPDYSLKLVDSISLRMSDVYPEYVDYSIDWETLATLLEPQVFDASGKEVAAEVSLSCSDYETLVDFTKLGEYELNVVGELKVGFLSYTKNSRVVVRIIDETKPELNLAVKRITLPKGFSTSDLADILTLVGYEAYDNSGVAPNVSARIVAYKIEEIDWQEMSEYGVYLYATDASGNEAVRENFIFTVQ